MSLNEVLREAQDMLSKYDEKRLEVEALSRKIIRLTKKAIFLTHQEKFEETEITLKEIGKLLLNLKEAIQEYPQFASNGFVNTAFQEFAEASLYYNLVKRREFIDLKEIDVSPSQYLLGLADCIGELRRRVLDLIRSGRIKEAEETLEIMDKILYELNLNSDLQVLVSGLRRKCDIARAIIEATRGDVTLEARRISLEKSMKRLIDLASEKEKQG